MKHMFKKLAFAAVAATTVAGLASCKGGNTTEEKPHITVGVIQDYGNNFVAMQNWLNEAQSVLNFTWDYVLMDSRNDANNLTALQNKLNAGTQGIISMVDMQKNNLSALLKNIEANDAYYAGYLQDMTNAGDLLDNERILGSVTDGESGPARGEALFNQLVKTNYRKVVFAQFPSAYFPAVVGAVDKFKELAITYNASHDDKFTYYSGSGDNYPAADTYQMTFQTATLPDAEYNAWKSAGVEAVVSVNSLAKRLVGPTAKDSGDPIKIYSVGWDDEILANFGEDKVVRTQAQSQAEYIVYPLVQILNAIRGQRYTDEPKTGKDKVLTGHYIFITSNADLEAGKTNTMNFSQDHAYSKTIIKVEEARKLLASDGGTFANMKAKLDSFTSSYVLYRK